ncbi:uncharacterized protein LOC116294110 isoform X2 [Actinia tenebrosa]|uniref:Uncharacterized protein LOC116294110 isoform X2 n=1 Tax=Actinia tenebrosa TaxID=6105 RepID=A0A6P8HMC3_ACTTE|nr:uncharacterized protein LOC116294110 isoform X2 [Actinia tenebrosa]
MASSDAEEEELEDSLVKTRLLDPDTFPENIKQQKQGDKLLAYLQCYFVTIAAILGTGILGLPVKLSNSGFMPFLLVFVLGFFAQALVIYYFVEILQKAFVIEQDEERKNSMLFSSEGVPLQDVDENKEDDSGDENEKQIEPKQQDSSKVTYQVSDDVVSMSHYPSLHSLAELFLGPGLQQLFDLAIILMFVSLLISYSLAGSQAYAQLGNFQLLYVIPVFTWVCTFIIIFLQSCVQPFVSVLTFCKGTLFTACVLAAMYVGYFVRGEIAEDIRSVGEPFLMGTVALGGVVNVMPMIFTKIKLQATQVLQYRQAIIAGTFTCTILNILWCYAVLEIVPQKQCFIDSPASRRSLLTSNVTDNVLKSQESCSRNSSLQWAEANGQISTIPLTEILHKEYSEFAWIAVLIQVFVMISITVSFLTMGAALRHMMDGWFDSFFTVPKKNWQQGNLEKNRCGISLRSVIKTVGLLLVFGFVFTVAMINPKGFVTILENATSFIMNLESGVFVVIMLNRAHAQKYRHLGVPVPLSRFLIYLKYPVVLYFLIAVGYDVVEIIHHSLHSQTFDVHRLPPLRNAQNLSESINASGLLHLTHNRRWRVYNFINSTN